MKKVLIVCTTDSMIWNFLTPHIDYLKRKGFQVECACSRTGFYFAELENRGYILHEIQFERNPFRIQNIKAFFKLRKLIKSGDFDIIHCHEPVGGAMGRLAGYSCGKSIIYFAHGFHFFKGAPKINTLYYFFELFLSYFTDILLTINKEDYIASKKFYAKENYLIHGIGIDTSKFIKKANRSYLKTEFNLSLDNNYILSVGELIPRKNHVCIIKAMSSLPNNIHYLIVGDGSFKEDLLKEVKKRELEGRVHFLGFRKDISSICNAVDMFVFPSLQEGLSVALMEAMAVGLPVVVSNIRGNIDLIDEEKGGYLVDVSDSDEYAKKIKELFEDPSKMIAFGQYNQEKIKLFDIKNVLKELDPLITNK